MSAWARRVISGVVVTSIFVGGESSGVLWTTSGSRFVVFSMDTWVLTSAIFTRARGAISLIVIPPPVGTRDFVDSFYGEIVSSPTISAGDLTTTMSVLRPHFSTPFVDVFSDSNTPQYFGLATVPFTRSVTLADLSGFRFFLVSGLGTSCRGVGAIISNASLVGAGDFSGSLTKRIGGSGSHGVARFLSLGAKGYDATSWASYGRRSTSGY